jgi:hypothetical protein
MAELTPRSFFPTPSIPSCTPSPSHPNAPPCAAQVYRRSPPSTDAEDTCGGEAVGVAAAGGEDAARRSPGLPRVSAFPPNCRRQPLLSAGESPPPALSFFLDGVRGRSKEDDGLAVRTWTCDCMACWPRQPMQGLARLGPSPFSFFSIFLPPARVETLLGRPTMKTPDGPLIPARFNI